MDLTVGYRGTLNSVSMKIKADFPSHHTQCKKLSVMRFLWAYAPQPYGKH